MRPQSPESIDPPANVLLLGADSPGEPTCEQLLDRADVTIRVIFQEEQPERPSTLESDRLGYVWVRPEGGLEGSRPDYDADFAVATVGAAEAVPESGMATSRFCEEWGGRDTLVGVCFESVGTLFENAQREQVFRFVHLIANRLEEAGALAHFHLEPGAVDRGTAATFMDLLDAVAVQDTVTAPESGAVDLEQMGFKPAEPRPAEGLADED